MSIQAKQRKARYFAREAAKRHDVIRRGGGANGPIPAATSELPAAYADHILLEYMDYGDLEQMLIRVNTHFPEPIPNRILWSFFLCREFPWEVWDGMTWT